MRNATDVQVTDTVSISRQLYNTNKKMYREQAIMIDRAITILKNIMDIPEDFKVRIAKFKCKYTNGQFFETHNIAKIAPNFYITSMIQILAHEMVHAEQYKQGRLKTMCGIDYWHDVPSLNKGTTYKRYRNLPWEVEAFNRQVGLADKVFKIMGI